MPGASGEPWCTLCQKKATNACRPAERHRVDGDQGQPAQLTQWTWISKIGSTLWELHLSHNQMRNVDIAVDYHELLEHMVTEESYQNSERSKPKSVCESSPPLFARGRASVGQALLALPFHVEPASEQRRLDQPRAQLFSSGDPCAGKANACV